MAKENVTNVEELIDALHGEACFYTDSSDKGLIAIGNRLQITANVMEGFRDTLISIALNQNGMASHQAQNTLKMSGYCYHFNTIFSSETTGKFPREAYWLCQDCHKESAERPVAYR